MMGFIIVRTKNWFHSQLMGFVHLDTTHKVHFDRIGFFETGNVNYFGAIEQN